MTDAEWNHARLQDLLLESDDLTNFLTAFTNSIAQDLSTEGGEVWCAVTLLRERRPTTVASSSPQAKAMDELQFPFDEGPCLTAAREHRIVEIQDTRTDTRWPGYAQVAANAGVLSALGIPFELGDEARAGLNIYLDRPHAYDQRAVENLREQVLEASTALRLAVRLARHQEAATDLKAAMVSRTPIDVAVGIVMGQNQCSQEEAFTILKTVSNNRNVKLRDLALELVASVGRKPPTTFFEG